MSDSFQKKPAFRRPKGCPLTGDKAPNIDWKDVKMLGRYITERGKITPSRITSCLLYTSPSPRDEL